MYVGSCNFAFLFSLALYLREGFKKKKKIVENSTKGGGGSATADFPLRKKKHGPKTLDMPDNHLRYNYFFQFLVGGTLFSSDHGPKVGSNLNALWRSHLPSVKRPSFQFVY